MHEQLLNNQKSMQESDVDLFTQFEKMKFWNKYFPNFNYSVVIDKYNSFNLKIREKFHRKKIRTNEKCTFRKSIVKNSSYLITKKLDT